MFLTLLVVRVWIIGIFMCLNSMRYSQPAEVLISSCLFRCFMKKAFPFWRGFFMGNNGKILRGLFRQISSLKNELS
jgi:hypothetical protein